MALVLQDVSAFAVKVSAQFRDETYTKLGIQSMVVGAVVSTLIQLLIRFVIWACMRIFRSIVGPTSQVSPASIGVVDAQSS